MNTKAFASHSSKDDGFVETLREPLDELLLELTDPCIVTKDGTRRAQASAKLKYCPGESGTREVESRGRFLFTSPMGIIEQEELRWYLEKYYIWPASVFKQRAQRVEIQLEEWGQALYNGVMSDDSVARVLDGWNGTKTKTGKRARRFTVFVDSQLGREETEKQAETNEAATMLLGLPWELLHDGRGFLFQGAKPIRVRRRLPNTKSFEPLVSQRPIRILLVSPRPDDERAGYLDHRASAEPLVSALESLGDSVRLTVLTPPTFKALEDELLRAQDAGTPYHAVHFDGHGVYNKAKGLGELCFEDPADSNKLVKRKSQTIDARKLAAIIRVHRIPLFFLDACESAKAQVDPTASVAAALLDEGVASVVAMSHSVLVETSRRFVRAFYHELTEGSRVGEAMLSGQRKLKGDRFRMKIFGAGQLDLEDWFVPVLYQEKEDLQLLTAVSSEAIQEMDQAALKSRLGALPEPPEHTFIGRSRELLTLERLLEQKRYAVLCGQGGEGKTTLGVELARWLVRTNRFHRAVFVCMEDVYDVRTVVDQIGRQLVPNYSVAQYSNEDVLTKALLPIELRLRKDITLIILDNMESVLPPPSLHHPKGGLEQDNVVNFDPDMLTLFFDLCQKLMTMGDTRLLFTSREALPEPWDSGFQRVMLGRLNQKAAIELVHQAMTVAGLSPKEDESGGTQPEVEELVESVNCHARSLVLLAPFVSEFGVSQTTQDLHRLMADLHQKHPDERERSLVACVELSLRRLSSEVRETIKSLGVFQGGGHIENIKFVLELEDDKLVSLIQELLQTGLIEVMPYNFLRFHPGLCPYLLQEMGEAEREASLTRWAETTQQLIIFLYEISEDACLSATLTTLGLPNMMHLLRYTQTKGNSDKTVKLATTLEQLVSPLGRRRLLTQIVSIREQEAKTLTEWGSASFNSSKARIERLLESGNVPDAYQEAKALLEKCLKCGEAAYPGADYDTALAYILIGSVINSGGDPDAALPFINGAYFRFQRLANKGREKASRMAAVSLSEKGECLRKLGRLDEAAEAYQSGMELDQRNKDMRSVAAGKAQLATVRLLQERYDEALAAYEDAMQLFEEFGEPLPVATLWHQIGIVHEKVGRWEAAEQAYQKALSINIKQNDRAGEAGTLGQLGILYRTMGRLEESVVCLRQAADQYVAIHDLAKEGVTRSNLANTLIKLKRYKDARRETMRAIECNKPYGQASKPWLTWDYLCKLEQAEGNPDAAANARNNAIQLFLAYRRDGGENLESGGRFWHWFTQALKEEKPEKIETVLTEVTGSSNIPQSGKVLLSKLKTILAGSRDPALAEDPELDYDDAVEIVLLLEKLAERDKAKAN
ncbi:MAG: tetratricopeptide repeat protein [Candidatus Omnitrophota bacterium]